LIEIAPFATNLLPTADEEGVLIDEAYVMPLRVV